MSVVGRGKGRERHFVGMYGGTTAGRKAHMYNSSTENHGLVLIRFSFRFICCVYHYLRGLSARVPPSPPHPAPPFCGDAMTDEEAAAEAEVACERSLLWMNDSGRARRPLALNPSFCSSPSPSPASRMLGSGGRGDTAPAKGSGMNMKSPPLLLLSMGTTPRRPRRRLRSRSPGLLLLQLVVARL